MASFRGSTSDCAQDYGGRYNVASGLGLMAEFTDVVVPTTLGWVRGENLPTGDTLLKLRCFLHIVGYRVEEFVELPKPTRHFAELVSLGVMSVKEAADQLGYRNTQDLYRVLLRGQGLLPDKVHKLQRIVSDHEEQRRALIDGWRTRLASSRMGVGGSEEGQDTGDKLSSQDEVSAPVIVQSLAVTLLVQNLAAASKLLSQIQTSGGPWTDIARLLLNAEISDEQLNGLRAWLSTPPGEVDG